MSELYFKKQHFCFNQTDSITYISQNQTRITYCCFLAVSTLDNSLVLSATNVDNCLAHSADDWRLSIHWHRVRGRNLWVSWWCCWWSLFCWNYNISMCRIMLDVHVYNLYTLWSQSSLSIFSLSMLSVGFVVTNMLDLTRQILQTIIIWNVLLTLTAFVYTHTC